MTLIKRIFKILAVTTLLSSANVFAADFLVNTTIDDSGDYVNGAESKYGIDRMNVSSVGDLVTVDIYTNFVNYNKSTSAGGKNIVFGDLLISTAGSSDYDYAFVLSEGRSNSYKNNSSWKEKDWDNDGTLTKIDSTITSETYHNYSSAVGSGEVMSSGTDIKDGSWSVTNYGKRTGNTDLISFSFNVNGIDAFQNASQLAFSWGMSCANDIVSGVANVTRSVNVPEPAAWLLMLLALGFMVNRRNKKADNFSA
ncbi:PEP-CTERM sorting domain-containing protein [Colwellia echini]|uniref:PEP-CTERM sorting domain-containing protein n=1 Tax=Colwellia echini TaxID=1982103 RepID=A0ABY3MZ97_9GAMM|nr:PEP-CTERM sorting domain-containing protein [Colwellia echini]TYK66556.1 PEP-CTERM sorting domain-containing protein [Colwellia echini]